MRGKRAKEIRNLVNRFSKSRSATEYKPNGRRVLKRTSSRFIEKVIKRLVKHSPWTIRHLIIPSLLNDSNKFLTVVNKT